MCGRSEALGPRSRAFGFWGICEAKNLAVIFRVRYLNWQRASHFWTNTGFNRSDGVTMLGSLGLEIGAACVLELKHKHEIAFLSSLLLQSTYLVR